MISTDNTASSKSEKKLTFHGTMIWFGTAYLSYEIINDFHISFIVVVNSGTNKINASILPSPRSGYNSDQLKWAVEWKNVEF